MAKLFLTGGILGALGAFLFLIRWLAASQRRQGRWAHDRAGDGGVWAVDAGGTSSTGDSHGSDAGTCGDGNGSGGGGDCGGGGGDGGGGGGGD